MKRFAIRFLAAAIFAVCVFGTAQADEKREDIYRLIEMTGTVKIADQVIATTMHQAMNVMRVANPNIPESVLDEIEKEGLAEFNRSLPGFIELVAIIFDVNFTHDEIKDLIEFYESPTGKKIIEKMPLVMQQSMAVGERWGEEVGKRVAERIISKAREKGYEM